MSGRVRCAVLIAGVLTACAHWRDAHVPTLEFMAGARSGTGCLSAKWTGPWDEGRICLDESTAIALERTDLHGFRLEERTIDQRTWYIVSVYPTEVVSERLRRLDPIRGLPAAALIDAEVSFGSAIPGWLDDWPIMIAATQDLSTAESIAYQWGAPVHRVLSAEIARQTLLSASLVQLIADPAHWAGKRVEVRGFLDSTFSLYLSREHAEARDDSSILLAGVASGDVSEQTYDAWMGCSGGWVLAEGFAERDRGGSLVLRRIERLVSISDWNQCWPVAATQASP